MNPNALTLFPTPLFNTPNLVQCFGGKDGNSLPLDAQNLMRTLETVLFPGTPVTLIKQSSSPFVWQITTDAYSYPQELFLDIRFLSFQRQTPTPRPLPSPAAILETLRQLENTRYIWGGNWPEGIPLIPTLYPSKTDIHTIDPLVRDTWLLKGVDCSGLLYYATNGNTPRNTSSLVHFGDPVDIEGRDVDAILKQLKPLDILVWEGHVLCLLDENTIIESKPRESVVKTASEMRLAEILKTRKPINTWNANTPFTFVARRWISN